MEREVRAFGTRNVLHITVDGKDIETVATAMRALANAEREGIAVDHSDDEEDD